MLFEKIKFFLLKHYLSNGFFSPCLILLLCLLLLYNKILILVASSLLLAKTDSKEPIKIHYKKLLKLFSYYTRCPKSSKTIKVVSLNGTL